MCENKIYIVGMGGLGLEVLDTLITLFGEGCVGGFFDDKPFANTHGLLPPYLGTIEDFKYSKTAIRFVCAIGNDRTRQLLFSAFMSLHKKPVTLVHPQATVAKTSLIEEGVYIGTNTFIGPHVKIGHGCLINVNTSIGHGSVIGAFSQLCPGARVSGECVLGEGVFLGSNAVLAQRTVVGNRCKLSACSFAYGTLQADTFYFGNPAKSV